MSDFAFLLASCFSALPMSSALEAVADSDPRLTVASSAVSSAGAPRVHNRVVATIQGTEVELIGRDFGAPQSGSALILRSGGVTRTVPSTAPEVTVWEDTRIVLALEADAPSGSLRVRTPQGASKPVTVDVYAYDWFDIPPTPGTNALPLSIAVDDQHRVWVNQEFHKAFQMLDPADGQVVGLDIPVQDQPGPFASTIFSDHRTTTSVLGEDVLVDPQGRVWFTQGGGHLYSGQHPNHSRVVCVLPDAPGGPEFRAYNVPGDWNEVTGLAWDPTREWIWFCNAGMTSGAHLVGFDPELMPWDNDFAFDSLQWRLVGFPGDPKDPVYHAYRLPRAQGYPAHLQVAADGKLWFTYYWGRALGRLDPTSGEVTEYPVPQGKAKSGPGLIVGPGPWELVQAPNGDLVFNEFFDCTITRFDLTRADDPATWKLDALGRNPGMTDWVLPRADLDHERIHSIDYGPDGKLWYSIHATDASPIGGSLGYLTADGEHMTRLPSLDRFPGTGTASADGVAVDHATGAIWFCEFQRKRIGRLTPVPELP